MPHETTWDASCAASQSPAGAPCAHTLDHANIHQLNDGDRRMIKALAPPLMHQSGHNVKSTSRSKRKSNARKRPITKFLPQALKTGGEARATTPLFFTCMLGIIDASCQEPVNRLLPSSAPAGNEGALRTAFDQLTGPATKQEIWTPIRKGMCMHLMTVCSHRIRTKHRP